MKKIIFFAILLILMPFSLGRAQIVSNGTSSEDSIAVSVFLTDSLGNPLLQAPDSFSVAVIGPSGDSVFAQSGTQSTSGFPIDSFLTAITGWNYTFGEAIQNIDGTGRSGSYELRFCAKKNSPQFINCYVTRFQITESHLSAQLEMISEILDSMTVALDSINLRIPDVNLYRVSGDLNAADNLESMLDGTGGSQLTLSRLKINGTNGDSASINVLNSSGTAVVFESSGGNGSGLLALGDGSGEGIKGEGGVIGGGHGIQGVGGIGGGDIAGDIAGSVYGQVYGNIYGFSTPTDTNASGVVIARIDDSISFQGQASGLSKAQIADTLIKAGMIRYSSPDSILQLRGLKLVGTQPGDTAFLALGSGSGHGAYIASAGTGHGAYFRGGLTSGHGIIGWTSDGYGMALFGSKEKSGLYCEATDSGAGAYFMGGDEVNGSDSGPGIRIRGRADDGIYISAGSQPNKHGLQIDGGSGAGGDAVRILGKGAGGDGVSISADDGASLDIISRDELVKSFWGYPLDTAWTSGSFGDSAKSWASSSPLGGGIYSVRITAFDSGHTQVIPSVRLSVFNTVGEALIATGITDQNGHCRFNLDAGNYMITGFTPGYILSHIDSLTVSASASDSLTGYQFDPGLPAVSEMCRVYGFLYGIDGRPVEGVTVTAVLNEGGTRMSAVIISPLKRMAVTDSTGYFALDLIPSSKLSPALNSYSITAGNASGIILRRQIQVPEQPNWQLTW
ncbi:MAG: carboxypeptidase regulatory-like domain-containing protein [candidate division Zixibacteria bacterium]|nr:carboxypeptidase regulatory-like domain-containing protein [candidate division Zixibacteria bacterium]